MRDLRGPGPEAPLLHELFGLRGPGERRLSGIVRPLGSLRHRFGSAGRIVHGHRRAPPGGTFLRLDEA